MLHKNFLSSESLLADFTNEFPVRTAVSTIFAIRTKLLKTNKADCFIIHEVSIVSLGEVADELTTTCNFSSTSVNAAFKFRYHDSSCSSRSVGNVAALCVILDDSVDDFNRVLSRIL